MQYLFTYLFFRNKNKKPHEARDENFIGSPMDFSITSTPLSTLASTTEEPATSALSGRRIVDIGYFIQQLQQMSAHSPFGCSFSDMKLISERKMGLNSALKFKCMMCNTEKIVWTNTTSKSTSSLGINTAAVTGTLGIGAGFANLEEFLNSLNIPCMSKNTYASEHKVVSNAWEQCATEEMKIAVEEEKEMAVQRGDIDTERIPLLTVIVDGTWSKRSYRTNYASLSGAVSKFISLFIYLMLSYIDVQILNMKCGYKSSGAPRIALRRG